MAYVLSGSDTDLRPEVYRKLEREPECVLKSYLSYS